MDDAQVLAFRLARSGLAERRASTLAEAAACPASDFARDAALLALAARMDGLTRAAYDRATDDGSLVVAHVLRCAIHAVAPQDHGLWGRALVGRSDAELSSRFTAAALEEVAAATADALAAGPLDKNGLHDALRARVRDELLVWCEVCRSRHVGGTLWRYATIVAGARLDSQRRYILSSPQPADPVDALRRFLRFYGPSDRAAFRLWAEQAAPFAKRLWAALQDELVETGHGLLLREDVAALDAPPQARGIRLLPPGDPYLQAPNRRLLAPDPALHKRMFRPVGSPGAILQDGRLAGLWKARTAGRRADVEVEALEPLRRDELEAEAAGVAALRGSSDLRLTVA
jgi:hypothetical protein